VMISIDGPPETADLHRRDLGGRGQTAKAVANAQKLIARQKQAGLRTSMIRATMAPGNTDLLAIQEYFRDAGFERTMVGASSGRAYHKGPGDLTEEHRPAVQAAFDTQIEQYLAWVDGTGPQPAGDSIRKMLARLEESLTQPKLRPSVGCGVARNMQAITEDGSIYPCHRYAGDKDWVIGHLSTGLDPHKTARYYREILSNYDKHCSHCVARFTCGGQCPWYLSLPDGSVGLPDDASCDAIRGGMEKQIGLLVELRHRRARGNRAAELAAAETKEIDET
ncbi:MAG: SPASM domain-containing protein, partial [Planctomycetota bacterium]